MLLFKLTCQGNHDADGIGCPKNVHGRFNAILCLPDIEQHRREVCCRLNLINAIIGAYSVIFHEVTTFTYSLNARIMRENYLYIQMCCRGIINWTACLFNIMFVSHLIRLLYPEVNVIKWVQCKTCRGWLHQDCAGIEMEPFDCGCEDSIEHPRYNIIYQGNIVSVKNTRLKGWKNEGLLFFLFLCRIKDAVDSGGIHAVFSKTQIKVAFECTISC